MKCPTPCFEYFALLCNYPRYFSCRDYQVAIAQEPRNKAKEDLRVWEGIKWNEVVELEETRRVSENGNV